MPRKLKILSVATLLLFAASFLQAQQCECPAKAGSAKADCQTCQKSAATGQPATCPVDCQQCDQSQVSCDDCTRCQMSGQLRLPGTHMAAWQKLPGSTSFIDQQSGELAVHRALVAEQLTEYLTSGNHSPDHIRVVLEIALDATADHGTPAD